MGSPLTPEHFGVYGSTGSTRSRTMVPVSVDDLETPSDTLSTSVPQAVYNGTVLVNLPYGHRLSDYERDLSVLLRASFRDSEAASRRSGYLNRSRVHAHASSPGKATGPPVVRRMTSSTATGFVRSVHSIHVTTWYQSGSRVGEQHGSFGVSVNA